MIASEELEAAIVDVITDHTGTGESETFSSVAKLLGNSNSKRFQAVVQEQTDQLMNDSGIAESSGRSFAG